MMTEFYARHVIGNGVFSLGHCHDLGGWHEQEHGLLIDEPGDQPRARNAIDSGLFSGDPLHCFLLSSGDILRKTAGSFPSSMAVAVVKIVNVRVLVLERPRGMRMRMRFWTFP